MEHILVVAACEMYAMSKGSGTIITNERVLLAFCACVWSCLALERISARSSARGRRAFYRATTIKPGRSNNLNTHHARNVCIL